MGIQLIIAARNLLQAKRRSLFLTLALSIVTMLLVMLLSLSQGLTDTLVRSATALSAGHINVAGFYKSTANGAAPIVLGVEKIKEIALRSTPNVDYVIDRHRGWGRIVSETSALQAGLSGIDIHDEPHFRSTVQLAEEREYKEGGRKQILGSIDDLAKPGSIMLFAAQAKRLGVTVGDQITVVIELLNGARNTGELTIVAIARDMGMLSNWSVFVHKKTVLDLYHLQPDTTGAVMIYLKDINDSEQSMGTLREAFSKEGYLLLDHDPNPFWMKFEKIAAEDWLGQKLDLTIWSDEVSFVKWVFTAINTISFFLLGILLVIIVIGIMNSMYISVRERTREIGTIRSIGMSRLGVLNMFMTEAVMLGLFATTLGGVVGALIAKAIDAASPTIPIEAVQAILMSDKLHLVVDPVQVLIAVVVFTAVTAGAALFPALRGAWLQPVDAIHSVG